MSIHDMNNNAANTKSLSDLRKSMGKEDHLETAGISSTTLHIHKMIEI